MFPKKSYSTNENLSPIFIYNENFLPNLNETFI